MVQLLKSFLILIFVTTSHRGFSCSFLQLGTSNNYASAQNFDFPPDVKVGIIINKRNVEKTDGDFDGAPSAPSAKWVSKYGSVTFGFGSDNPVTGVNEVGLRVYRFLFMKGRYPTPNSLPAMHESQYVQYLLDTTKDINEVIQRTTAVQIYTASRYPTHFAVCDRTTQCLIIEAVEGVLHIFKGADVKVSALTNTDYPRSLDLLTKCPSADCPYINNNSEWRFVHSALKVLNFSGTDFMKGTFDILNSVNEIFPDQPMPTLFTLLTHENSIESKFYVKNTKFSNIIMTLDLKKLDYSCKTPKQVALMSPADPSSPALVDYSVGFQKILSEMTGKYLGVSAADVQRRTEYPDKFTRCLD